MPELSSGQAAAVTGPAEPRLIHMFDSEGHGRWYAGEVPGGAADRPVLVFVPGLGQSAECFWRKNELYDRNDLYLQAFTDGFRTAFVSFMADGEKPADMWGNAKLLAWQLEDICRYYSVDRVMVAAHSKGGVDTQAAASFFGAAPRISALITLSTPHWGSQLADLAYSTYGWELAEILGQHSAGCFCMQTSYMKNFRRMADAQTAERLEIRTLAGCGGAPAFTPLWAGKLWMSIYGPNDGVVTVKSAQNPKGTHLGTLPFNHTQMVTGQAVWPYLRAAVLGLPLPQPAQETERPESCGMLLRGGRLENGVGDELPVDSTVRSLELLILLAGARGDAPAGQFELFDPEGRTHGPFSVMELPNGLKILHFSVAAPGTGKWHLISSAPGSGAYAACVRLYGTFRAFPQEIALAADAGLRTLTRIVKTEAGRLAVTEETGSLPGEFGRISYPGGGAFTIETIVKGLLPDGTEFERNVLKPVLSGLEAVASAAGAALSKID